MTTHKKALEAARAAYQSAIPDGCWHANGDETDAPIRAAIRAYLSHLAPADNGLVEKLQQTERMLRAELEAEKEAHRLTRVAEAVQVKPLDDLLSRISVFRDTEPEEDETWESWYFAAFDLLRIEAVAIRASLILTAREPGCGYFQGAEGALRFVVCACVVAMLAAIYFLVERLL